MTNHVSQIFEEWLRQEYPLVRPEGEHLGKLRKAFYTGAWVALGYVQRTSKMPDNRAVQFMSEVNAEIRAVIYEQKDKARIITGGLN